MTGGGGVRPDLSPTGEPAVDEARVAGEADVGADAESLGDAGSEHLEHRVGLLDDAEERVGAVGVLEVDGRSPVCRAPSRSSPAEGSTRPGDLDAIDAQHLRAEVGEEHAAERPGAEPDELDDSQPARAVPSGV